MKTFAFRLAHLGVLGGLIAMAIVIVLLIQNTYLLFCLRALRAQISRLEEKIDIHRLGGD